MGSDSSVIFSRDVTFDEVGPVGTQIAQSLLKETKENFVLWLSGDLGAGKTTMAGAILHGLGVLKSIPILSPTFTYMTEYRTQHGLFAHMDLYRLVDGDEDSLEMLLGDRSFRGVLVEWPERISRSKYIEKTHELSLKSSEQNDLVRRILFKRAII